MKKLQQEGSSHVVAFLAVAVLIVIGVVGYRVMQNKNTTVTVTVPTTSSAVLPTKINSKADIQKASKALDAAPIKDNLDPKQLDNELKNLL